MKKVAGKKEPLKNALVQGDTGYFSEENLQEAAKRRIKVLIPDQQFRQRDPYFTEKNNEKVEAKKKFTQGDFIYDKKKNLCPAGKVLEYKCDVTLRNNSGKQYRAKSGDCANCPLIDKCIIKRGGKNTARTLYVIDKKYENNLSEKMREKIDDPAYRELYSRRMQIIEPVFSNITYCKGMDRFTLRTKEKVNTQWQLYCIVYNIRKCMNALAMKMGVRGN